MIDAMYGVQFKSSQLDFGDGIVVFESGRVFGGDGTCIYLGTYELSNGVIRVNVKVTNDLKIGLTVFDPLNEFHLRGEATLKDKNGRPAEFIMQGEMIENPAKKILVKFTRRAELP